MTSASHQLSLPAEGSLAALPHLEVSRYSVSCVTDRSGKFLSMLAQFLLEGTDLGLGFFPQTSAVWFHISFGLSWSGMGVGSFQGILTVG